MGRRRKKVKKIVKMHNEKWMRLGIIIILVSISGFLLYRHEPLSMVGAFLTQPTDQWMVKQMHPVSTTPIRFEFYHTLSDEPPLYQAKPVVKLDELEHDLATQLKQHLLVNR
jgi:hypothetical protein